MSRASDSSKAFAAAGAGANVMTAFPANLINIGVMTARKQMRFCLRYSRSNISDEAAKRVYLEAVELLARL